MVSRLYCRNAGSLKVSSELMRFLFIYKVDSGSETNKTELIRLFQKISTFSIPIKCHMNGHLL
ncbi:hypothetical protein T05_3405 [Trichinella murrelli]|uniref:Uncharacterized protein n=1 Tax=Trichinella murrelli TaxID=144512 RepID=A0A0V0UBV9_9BILA|nr:hypothetical protein T05_3405 [Trichinella murrelli]